jgi:hypothetical protein
LGGSIKQSSNMVKKRSKSSSPDPGIPHHLMCSPLLDEEHEQTGNAPAAVSRHHKTATAYASAANGTSSSLLFSKNASVILFARSRACKRRSTQVLLISIACVFILALLQGRFLWMHIRETKRGSPTSYTNPSGGEYTGDKSALLRRSDGHNDGGKELKFANSYQHQEDAFAMEAINSSQQKRIPLESNGICQQILSFTNVPAFTSEAAHSQHSSSSTSKVWMESIVSILVASQHPDDPDFSHQDWTKSLLAELSPSQLEKTIATRTTKQKASGFSRGIEGILGIVHRRMNNPNMYPPLTVAVLGGSDTEGNGCERASVHVPKNSMMGNPTYCAWPYRLEAFVNALVGIPILQVVNMGEEGTSTTAKSPLLKYWMYPPPLLPEGPDVIIHAYRAHDVLPFEHANESLTEALHRELETLTDAVQLARPCGDPPLVIHMADTEIDKSSVLTGRDSKMLVVDYVDAVQKVAAVDGGLMTQQEDKHNKPSSSSSSLLDFGMAAHLAMMWILAYNLGDAVIDHCTSTTRGILTDNTLSAILQPSNVAASATMTCQESPCIFAWLAGPTGTVRNADHINGYINPFVVENTGWNAITDMSTGWSRKAGLVAVKPHSRITLEYRDIPITTRMINVMSAKSSSDAYKESHATFKVMVVNTNTSQIKWESSFDVDGYFQEEDNNVGNGSVTSSINKASPSLSSSHSITFPSVVDLKTKSALKGDTVRLQIDLVGGSTFKILGMMFCSR